MKFILILLPILSLATGPVFSQAASDSQLEVISRLGELNGVALQCQYNEQMQNIKRSLVLNLPKQRALGLWFEQSTNTAFMAFINNNSTCPDSQEFARHVAEARNRLETEFRK